MTPDSGAGALAGGFPAVEFYYLRHGETDWNRDGRIQGCADTPLNATGRAQAEAAREALRGRALGALYVSPLRRARETAEIVNRAFGLPLIPWPGLEECRFGSFEGTVPAEREHDWHARWRGGAVIPGAETYAAFLDRAESALRRALEDSRRFAAPPLLVAHGGVYWSVQRALARPQRFDLRNGAPQHHRPPGASGAGWQVAAL